MLVRQAEALARAASANFAPPSPCAFAVPATSGMPLPISVFAMIICGFPLSRFFRLLERVEKAAMSWPSIFCTSKPKALKRSPVSSLCVSFAIASSVTAFES